MNNELIKKIITCNNDHCPEFVYSNPLLDKNITKALSKSYVKLLNISKNSNGNSTLRHTVVENIRKVCKIEPENHIKINEEATELLISFYRKQIIELSKQNVDKQLEAFLIRKWKESNYNTNHKPTINPEVTQALWNLDEKSQIEASFIEDIIHWNLCDKKCSSVLKDVWSKNIVNETDNNRKLFNEASIKLKGEIEKWLLNISYTIMENNSTDLDGDMKKNYNSLIKCCAISEQCFQMCISILNSIFIKTNFNLIIQKLVCSFIERIKKTSKVTISVLYPTHLNNLVILLDIDLEELLPISLRDSYVQNVLKHLKLLHELSENDFIMVLTHFPQWYDSYFDS